MRTTMRTTMLTAVLVLALAPGCSNDTDGVAEVEALQAEIEALEAERDELATQLSDREARHAASLATIEGVEAILADPEAFGSTEAEIADALGAFATEGALMDDAVFGAVDYRTGFYNTLFGGAIDADIDVYHHWLSEDGSQGGSLWVWYGTNLAGNPFELAGISLTDHDEDGRITNEFVTYPYPDEYVEKAVVGEGTMSATATAEPFSFAADDLCEWITEDELAEMVSTAYDWDGEATVVDPVEFTCRWELTGGDTVPPMVGIAEADHGDEPVRRWADGDPEAIGDVVTGHPEMSDEAAYVIGGFGYFAVGVPEDGRYLQLFVMMPDEAQTDDSLTHAIRLGDLVLHELGWIG